MVHLAELLEAVNASNRKTNHYGLPRIGADLYGVSRLVREVIDQVRESSRSAKGSDDPISEKGREEDLAEVENLDQLSLRSKNTENKGGQSVSMGRVEESYLARKIDTNGNSIKKLVSSWSYVSYIDAGTSSC